MPEPFPIPSLFLERMSCLLGEEYPSFEASLCQEPVHGLRVNTLKVGVDEFRMICPFPLGDKVAWCKSAFNLPLENFTTGDGPELIQPGKHPYHLAGLYYLQDPSAMSAAELLDPQPGERVLDLAAAPGGKTTSIASLMRGQGLLVANEIKTKRINHLIVNVERWGSANLIVTNESPERLADHFGPFFDRVLVDAPCSGEGMFRKDKRARLDWSTDMIAGCALRQTNILGFAAHLVRPGGHLLYSTCTFAPEEDEGVIIQFLQQYPDFEVEVLPQLPGFMRGRPDWFKFFPGKHDNDTSRDDSLDGAVRLFPHRLSGEGHFVCRMTRHGERDQSHHSEDRLLKMNNQMVRLWVDFADEVLSEGLPVDRMRVRGERLYLIPEKMPDFGHLRVEHPGIWLGTFKKERFEPAHPLALILKANATHRVIDFCSTDIHLQGYLHGETFSSQGEPGWTLISVDGFGIGWGKRVQGLVKNHFPKGWI
jgi:NOL1/NOP2/sun family putative RNA methylase